MPEMIISTTSVTSLKTNKFTTPLGRLDYHRMKPELFGFGYMLEDVNLSGRGSENNRKIMTATPQKAILDFFYINSYYNSEKEIENLRMNSTELTKIINGEFYSYLARFKSRALERRIHLMTKIYC